MLNPELSNEDEEGVVTPENIELTSDDKGEEEISLVEDETKNAPSGDPYNTADDIEKGPDELTSEKAANQALVEDAENRKAA